MNPFPAMDVYDNFSAILSPKIFPLIETSCLRGAHPTPVRCLCTACTLPARLPGGVPEVPRRLPAASCPPATSENWGPRRQWCASGVRLGGAQEHTYLEFDGRENFGGKIWRESLMENCHRHPWQEKGLSFVGLQIIVI